MASMLAQPTRVSFCPGMVFIDDAVRPWSQAAEVLAFILVAAQSAASDNNGREQVKAIQALVLISVGELL